MLTLSQLEQLAAQVGFDHFGPVNTAALTPSPAVRDMCASGRCQMYGHSWSCPPACGSVDAMERRIARFQAGLLLQTTAEMADDFDLDTIRAAEAVHKRRFEAIARQARQLDPACFPMSAGSCTRCRKCTYPTRPCRYPGRVFPSMEACGLLVSEVCTKSGLLYNYGPHTMTYTACILIGSADGIPPRKEEFT